MKLFFFVVSLIVLLVSVHSQPPPKKPSPPTTAIMQYVLQWAPTFCDEREKNPAATFKCQKPVAEEFTLHGLWPADSRGSSITTDDYDCSFATIDWDKVFTPIEANLRTFWKQLVEKSTERSMWQYQWGKHGACARDAKGVAVPVNDYFKAAITINGKFKQWNLIEYLKRSGIIACDNLAATKTAVVQAVQKVSGAANNVHVTCLPYNSSHDYLREVFICTTLDGSTFTPCPGTKNSCGNKIMLPHGIPKKPVSVQETQGISYIRTTLMRMFS